jgi:hypothetical protein
MAEPVLTSTRWIRSEEVLSRELDGELVLLDLQTEEYFGLDEVGVLVWALLEQPLSLDGLVEAVMAEYEVAEEQLRADLAALVAELAAAGLVAEHPATG